MNKGINPSKRLQILKNSHNSLIWNHIFLIFGFPSENKKEVEETISTFIKNKKIIDSYHAHLFSLQKHSIIKEKHDLFSIKEFIESEEFEECYNFIYGKEPFLFSKKVLLEKVTNLSKKFWEKKDTNICQYLLSTDFLLYLSKYGIDRLKVSKYYSITSKSINLDKFISNLEKLYYNGSRRNGRNDTLLGNNSNSKRINSNLGRNENRFNFDNSNNRLYEERRGNKSITKLFTQESESNDTTNNATSRNNQAANQT